MFVYCKCYISIELTSLKESMLMKQAHKRKCDICQYWYFLNCGFNIQQNVSNRYHYILMVSRNLSNIAILNIKSADYRCIISGIRTNEAINLMQNANFAKGSGTL